MISYYWNTNYIVSLSACPAFSFLALYTKGTTYSLVSKIFVKKNGGDVNKTRSSMFFFSLHHFTSFILPQYFVKHPLVFITAWNALVKVLNEVRMDICLYLSYRRFQVICGSQILYPFTEFPFSPKVFNDIQVWALILDCRNILLFHKFDHRPGPMNGSIVILRQVII